MWKSVVLRTVDESVRPNSAQISPIPVILGSNDAEGSYNVAVLLRRVAVAQVPTTNVFRSASDYSIYHSDGILKVAVGPKN
uniref:COesterase domain-containing protein n=1 Tax=Steinernema glaseri TaxID=37863 RepID=A0A1I7Z5A4_9BILA